MTADAVAPTPAPAVTMVLDCVDPERLAPFWAAALGYTVTGSVDDYTALVSDGRPGNKLLLQRVPEDKLGKNRMHLDLVTRALPETVARLQALGAHRISEGAHEGMHCSWVVMEDPEGNEFCVCDGVDADRSPDEPD